MIVQLCCVVLFLFYIVLQVCVIVRVYMCASFMLVYMCVSFMRVYMYVSFMRVYMCICVYVSL